MKNRDIGISLAEQGKYKDALFFFRKAVNEGDWLALNDIGVVYERVKKYDKAVEYYKKAAELGLNTALYNIGNLYEKGVVYDSLWHDVGDRAAVIYYERAMKAGYARAYSKLSWCYYTGFGIEKDYKKAFELAKKGYSLEKNVNDPACMVTLGFYYECGIGTKTNYKKAFKLYKKAVKFNSTTGLFDLALCYLYAKGTKKDVQKGIDLLIQATERGYADAFNELALVYREGEVVEKDINTSDYWLCQALDHRSYRALLTYAEIYMSGDNKEKIVDIEAAQKALARFLYSGTSDVGMEAYESLKSKYKDLFDWDSLEAYPYEYLKDKKDQNCLC